MSIYGEITMRELIQKLGVHFDVIYHEEADVKGMPALDLKVSTFSIEEEEGEIQLIGFYGNGGEFDISDDSIRKAQEYYLRLEAELKEKWAKKIVEDGYDYF